MNIRRLWPGVVLLALFPGLVWAGRPLDTEDPGTIDAGSSELEVSIDYEKDDARRSTGLKGVLGFGLLSNIEVRFESALLHSDPSDASSHTGLGDSLFGYKHRLLDEQEAFPALLFAFNLRLPTGNQNRGLGDEGVDAGLFAVLGKTLGPVTLAWNGGYTFISRDRSLDFWTLTGSLEYPPSETFSILGEVVSTFGGNEVPTTVALRVGALYALSKRVKLDASVAFGVTSASPDILATVGTTIALF